MTQHIPLDQEPMDQTPLDGYSDQEVDQRPQNNDDILMATGQEMDLPMAKSEFIKSNQMAVQSIIDEAFGLNAPVETVENAISGHAAKAKDFLDNPDFYYEQALTLNDPEVDPMDIKFAVNDRVGQELLEELVQQEKQSGGWVDAALDFGAMILRESTIGIPESLTNRTERRGTELLWHKINDTPSEFKAFMQGWIEDAREESLRSDNVWSIYQLQDEYYSNGVDFEEGLKKAFALVDLTGVGPLAKGALKTSVALAKTSTRGGRSAVIEGIEASADKAAKITSDTIDPELATDAGHGTLNPHKQPVSPSEGWYARAVRENELLGRVSDLYKSGAMGKVADEGKLREAAMRAADDFNARVGAPVARVELRTLELGRYQVEMAFGKSDGSAYKSLKDGSAPKGAQVLAKKLNGEVSPVNPDDASKGWLVKVRQNLATNQAIDAIDPSELNALENGLIRNTVGKLFGNQLMGSAALRGVEDLTTSAQLGEAFSAGVKREFMKEVRKIEGLKSKEMGALNSILGRLRDDPVEAAKRSWYTPQEFEVLYKAETGVAPTQKVKDAYQATIDVSDTAAALKALSIMDRYVEMGYKTIDLGDIKSPAKAYPEHKLAADDLVYDAEIGAVFRFNQLDEGYGTVFKLDKPQFDGVEYAVKPKGVGELSPEDVMGYNAGGPRANPNANYFVTIGGRRLKALLSSFTEASARLAKDQIEEIRQKYVVGNLTDEDVMRLNDWNPELTTVDELADYMRLHKWRFTDDAVVGYKGRDSDVLSVDVGADEASTGMKMHEYLENDMRRSDQVLPQFGGQKSFNVDPLTAIGQQFGSATQEFSFKHYTQRAMVGWVKEVQKKNRSWFPDTLASDDYRNLFMDAKITGNDAFAIRMREIRAIEMRRMHTKSEAARTMEAYSQKASEFVFQKTGKTTKFGDPVEALSNKMLTLGYHSAFGFLNVSQVVVQGSHAITIGAISPRGWKGATMALATRAFSSESPEVIQEMSKRLSKTLGMKPDDITEAMEYLRTSGRDVVDGDTMELGTGVGYGISSFGGESYNPTKLQTAWRNTKKGASAGLDKGLMFFNAGERLSRRTGIFTAILEFKAKNPGIPLTDETARRWITRREQDLTFHMTTSSRPLAQSGIMKVPTQWLSHTFRAMESVFVGRNFTKAERLRMFAVLGPMYGLSGFGMQNAASHIAEKFGIAEDSAGFTSLKWGAIDGLTDWLLPDTDGKQATGLAPRLAPFGAVMETYRKIQEGKFAEVIGGPSGEISKNFADAVVGSIGNLVYGRDVMLTEDIIKVLRQPSGVDNVFKAYGIFQNGIYRSKNGVTIPGEMSATDGVMTLLGLGTLKQTEWYDMRTSVFRSSKRFNDFRKEMTRDTEVAFAMLEDPKSQERALEMIDELHVKITLSGYSFAQQTQLRRAISRRAEDQWLQLSKTLLEQDRLMDQQRIGKTLGRFE